MEQSHQTATKAVSLLQGFNLSPGPNVKRKKATPAICIPNDQKINPNGSKVQKKAIVLGSRQRLSLMKSKRRIIETADGSKTIHLEDWGEQYHSIHGAIQEAYHVFISSGLALFSHREITILEMGFGTGLNALITLKEAGPLGLQINYFGVEKYPVSCEELEQLNYLEQLNAISMKPDFNLMHSGPWGKPLEINSAFTLCKQLKDFMDIDDVATYDLIYFDAFGARVQPELWTETLFLKMFNALTYNGILVTYAAKGSVRRAMQAVGFTVERLPGPPGKREMLRARKLHRYHDTESQ